MPCGLRDRSRVRLALKSLLMGCTSDPTETADGSHSDPAPATTSVDPVDPRSPSTTAAPDRLLLDEVPPPVARLVEDFAAFALDPAKESAELIPFADEGVPLGLQSHMGGHLPLAATDEPAAWKVNTKAGHVDGVEGPFSALELQQHVHEGSAGRNWPRESGDLQATLGPHPNCVRPPARLPRGGWTA